MFDRNFKLKLVEVDVFIEKGTSIFKCLQFKFSNFQFQETFILNHAYISVSIQYNRKLEEPIKKKKKDQSTVFKIKHVASVMNAELLEVKAFSLF